jgi:hypothetical protein
MRPPLELAWVWLALTVPAWPVVDRFLGIAGILLYSMGMGLSLLLAPRCLAAIPVRRVPALRLATFAVIVILFAAVYPRVNVQRPGAGSDDDDAHNAGAMALLAGQSPYSRTTYLGNDLHQLPGSFVLAAPFTLAGTSALQNLVCLPLFFLMLARSTRESRTPLVMAVLGVLMSAAVLHQVATGSSYTWNAIWVLAGIWWILERPGSVAAPVFLGIALCSRANFILLLAPLGGWLWRAHGPLIALRTVILAIVAIALLAVPAYVVSDAFGPSSVIGGLHDYDAVAPGAGFAMVIAAAAIACGVAFVRADRAGLFLQCALVQAFPVVALLMLSSMIPAGQNSLALAFYGTFASWFAVMGATIRTEPWLSSRASRQ